jgi:hypothetical protein
MLMFKLNIGQTKIFCRDIYLLKKKKKNAIWFKYLFEHKEMDLVFDNSYVYLYLF